MQWTEEARKAWAREKLQDHDIDPHQGVEESDLEYQGRLISEMVQRGYIDWEVTPQESIYLFSAQRRQDALSSPTLPESASVAGAGRTVEEAMLVTLAMVLDMMDT